MNPGDGEIRDLEAEFRDFEEDPELVQVRAYFQAAGKAELVSLAMVRGKQQLDELMDLCRTLGLSDGEAAAVCLANAKVAAMVARDLLGELGKLGEQQGGGDAAQ